MRYRTRDIWRVGAIWRFGARGPLRKVTFFRGGGGSIRLAHGRFFGVLPWQSLPCPPKAGNHVLPSHVHAPPPSQMRPHALQTPISVLQDTLRGLFTSPLFPAWINFLPFKPPLIRLNVNYLCIQCTKLKKSCVPVWNYTMDILLLYIETAVTHHPTGW
jgi:hypothetical protein